LIYLDASALVSLFLQDSHSNAVRNRFRSATGPFVVSTFGMAELASAVSLRVRTGATDARVAVAVLDLADDWSRQAAILVETAPQDVRAATTVVRRFDLALRAPDALHIAICLRSRADLLTYDETQARAAARLGVMLADRGED
jgi:uncharacterized protein